MTQELLPAAVDPAVRRSGWSWSVIRTRVLARLGWFFGWAMFAGFIAIVLSQWADERALLELLARASPSWVLLAILLQLAKHSAAGGLWFGVLRRLNAHVPWLSLVRLQFVKLFTDNVIPAGGVAGSVLVVRGFEKRGVDTIKGTTVILVGVLAAYGSNATSITIAATILALHGHLSPLVLAPIGVFAVVAVIVPSTVLALSGGAKPATSWPYRVPLLKNLLAAAARVPRRDLRNRGALLWAIAMEMLIVALDSATVFSLLHALGQDVAYSSVYAAQMVGAIAGMVSFVPGGLGTFDGAVVALLVAAGVSVEAALMSTLMFRAVGQLLPMLPGAIFARGELVTLMKRPAPSETAS